MCNIIVWLIYSFLLIQIWVALYPHVDFCQWVGSDLAQSFYVKSDLVKNPFLNHIFSPLSPIWLMYFTYGVIWGRCIGFAVTLNNVSGSILKVIANLFEIQFWITSPLVKSFSHLTIRLLVGKGLAVTLNWSSVSNAKFLSQRSRSIESSKILFIHMSFTKSGALWDGHPLNDV